MLESSSVKFISVLGLLTFNLEYRSDSRYMSVPYSWYVFAFELALKHICFTLPRVALLSPFSAAARSETHGT